MWNNNQRITSYELLSLWVILIARVTSYKLVLLHELRVPFCIRVTSYCFSYEFWVTFYIKVTKYYLLDELRFTFYIQITSYCLLHELWVTFIAWITSLFLHASYELLFIARDTSFIFAYELRVTVYCTGDFFKSFLFYLFLAPF